MASKKGRNCCCGGCFTLPRMNLATAALQPHQQWCCACIPLQICVLVEADDEYGNPEVLAVAQIGCWPTPTQPDSSTPNWPYDMIAYDGSVFINGTAVDVRFWLKVRGEGSDRRCYLCLESEALGYGVSDYDGCPEYCEQCLDVTPSAEDCYEDRACYLGEWEIDAYGIGDSARETVRIRTVPADNLNLFDSCPVVDCGNCRCICRCACITVIRNTVPNAQITTSVICAELEDVGDEYTGEDRGYKRPVWEQSSGYISRRVVLRPAEDGGCCVLRLEASDAPYPPGDVAITEFNSCPNPIAEWSYVDDDDVTVQVVWECHECGEQCGGVVSNCCGRRLSRVMVASVESSCYGCEETEIPLLTNDGAIWEGSGSFCDGPMELQLACGGTECEAFSLSGTGPNACTLTDVELVSCSCNPFRLEFTAKLTGINCCNSGDPMSPNPELTIVFTE